MNPDIQRIAEKWAEGYKDPQVSAYEVIKAALEELSALRDTQERELRGILSTGPEDERTLVEMVREERNLSEDLAERIDSLLGTIEDMKSGNAAHRRLCKQLNDRISWLESQREVECQQKIDAQKERDGFDSEVKSLRAELARRDEVEKELRGKLEEEGKYRMEDQAFMVKIQEDARVEKNALRSRIGELEAKYGVQEQLDHVFGQLPSNEEA